MAQPRKRAAGWVPRAYRSGNGVARCYKPGHGCGGWACIRHGRVCEIYHTDDTAAWRHLYERERDATRVQQSR